MGGAKDGGGGQEPKWEEEATASQASGVGVVPV